MKKFNFSLFVIAASFIFLGMNASAQQLLTKHAAVYVLEQEKNAINTEWTQLEGERKQPAFRMNITEELITQFKNHPSDNITSVFNSYFLNFPTSGDVRRQELVNEYRNKLQVLLSKS